MSSSSKPYCRSWPFCKQNQPEAHFPAHMRCSRPPRGSYDALAKAKLKGVSQGHGESRALFIRVSDDQGRRWCHFTPAAQVFGNNQALACQRPPGRCRERLAESSSAARLEGKQLPKHARRTLLNPNRCQCSASRTLQRLSLRRLRLPCDPLEGLRVRLLIVWPAVSCLLSPFSRSGHLAPGSKSHGQCLPAKLRCQGLAAGITAACGAQVQSQALAFEPDVAPVGSCF